MDLLSEQPFLSTARGSTGFDRKVGAHWIYPGNLSFRQYQFNLTRTALYNNTLLCLPTGLGRTFIAAVVMYNFFRWYPRSKIVFLSTQPLLAQQIDACHNIMGIPMSDMIDLKGRAEDRRIIGWKQYRIIFTTPYIFQRDLEHSIVPRDLIKCIVVDEAHKAIGQHPYTQSIRMVHAANHHFRVFALSATPCNPETIPEVIRSLHISRLEIRTDKSSDVIPFTHKRKMKIIHVNLGERLSQFNKRYEEIISGQLEILRENEFHGISNDNISKCLIEGFIKGFENRRSKSLNHQIILKTLRILLIMYNAYVLMTSHGLRSFLYYWENHSCESFLDNTQELQRLIQDVKEYIGPFLDVGASLDLIAPNELKNLVFGHGKFEMLRMILIKHFEKAGNNENNRRAIVFAEGKDIVNEIYVSLLQFRPLIRPQVFMDRVGQTQRLQMKTLEDFESNHVNVLISSVYDGYDISEADLVVCFDTIQCSPESLDQRIGRTAKSRNGQVIFFVIDEKECRHLEQGLAERDTLKYKFLNSWKIESALQQSNPRMIPWDIKQKSYMINMSVLSRISKKKRKSSEITSTTTGSSDTSDGEIPPKRANKQSTSVSTASSSLTVISDVKKTEEKLQADLNNSDLQIGTSNSLKEEGEVVSKTSESIGSSDSNEPQDIPQNSTPRISPNSSFDISEHSEENTLKICSETISEACSNNLPGVSLPEPMTVESRNLSAPRLQDHFRMLFQNKKNSDTVIIVDDQHFYVHKLILKTRSSVFAAIFDHVMKERSTNEIIIEDMKPEVIMKMLQFIYTDTIENYEEMAGELMIAAHNFSLDRLTVLCEQVLNSELKISNAVDTFIVADSCKSKSLETHVTKFIREHLLEIINTPDYKELEKTRPELACYFLRSIVSQETKN